MDVMDRIARPLVPFLPRPGGEELVIFIDRPGDDPEAELLGLLRLAVEVEDQALLRRIGQPFVDGDAIAAGLGDLLAILVEEQLVVEPLGRAGAEHAGDLGALDDRIDQILARHLVIDAKRDPAHRPVHLPLQLGAAGKDRLLDARALVVERDHAGLRVQHLDRDLQHLAAGRADREDGRIGAATLLAKRRQHDVENAVVAPQHRLQRLVETPRTIAIGRGEKLIVEAEPVEELPQQIVVVIGIARMAAAIGIWHAAERLVEMRMHHVLVRHAGRHLAHPVHIVAERDQPARPVHHLGERVADHQGPRHLLEGAEMRQARRPVAGLEDDRLLPRAVRIALQELARFLIGPGLGDPGGLAQFGGDRHRCPFVPHHPWLRGGRLFALSRAARNPWRHLDRLAGRAGRGGRAWRGGGARGRNPNDHVERAARRQPARLSRSQRARPPGAVRLRPSGALRGADAEGLGTRARARAAGERRGCGDLPA